MATVAENYHFTCISFVQIKRRKTYTHSMRNRSSSCFVQISHSYKRRKKTATITFAWPMTIGGGGGDSDNDLQHNIICCVWNHDTAKKALITKKKTVGKHRNDQPIEWRKTKKICINIQLNFIETFWWPFAFEFMRWCHKQESTANRENDIHQNK